MQLFILGLVLALSGDAQAPPNSNQTIAGAILPLPPPLQAGATVVRLDASFQPEVLRKGSNGMVCMTDRPNDDVFDVRCYRDIFIPVVYRAFQLGYTVSGPKVGDEIKAGKLRPRRRRIDRRDLTDLVLSRP